ncbi:MAG: type II toxin-antitoxin system VapC family toxin [candidate division KSB1 bacterium]|nr:type II toxin-antitoxin system VapC family toxin [candidate division KSB1 bacterium]MDZ7304660.1 type II toxin-antitoxin system VapC family toxin [candidate division KSB1 bacterium]MDZ7313808.1 type II toxin-antitoxin system VapC family toxin [candidate division KSB1 bacterium]
MKILLDTHIFLWYISGDTRLSDDKRASIQDLNNEVYLSVVSIWEAIVKYQIGRLQLPQPPEIYLPTQRERHQIFSLALDEASVAYLVQLPSIHRDPFDRMLICQANVHNLRLMTDDGTIHKYPVQIFT